MEGGRLARPRLLRAAVGRGHRITGEGQIRVCESRLEYRRDGVKKAGYGWLLINGQ
jgi:hypothetical protein